MPRLLSLKKNSLLSILRLSIWVAPIALSFVPNFVQIHAEENFQDPSSKTEFPTTVTVEVAGKPTTLTATGASTRSKFFVKVYSIAHYMQDPKTLAKEAAIEEAMTASTPKQFTLKWLRDVDAQKIKEGFNESFRKIASGEQYSALQPQINEFLKNFESDLKIGDVIVIRFLPPGTISVEKNGKATSAIDNKQFADLLWSLWLGDKSVVNRAQLVSRITSETIKKSPHPYFISRLFYLRCGL